jgi:hypothetical protein
LASWGQPPQPPWVGFAEFGAGTALCEAELHFFQKRTDTIRSIGFFGASPQTPWVGFAEFRVWKRFCEAELGVLLRLLEKKNTIRSIGVLGVSTKPPGPLHRVLEQISAKQNYAFCFFFWKKKESIRSIGFLGGSPQNPKVGIAE